MDLQNVARRCELPIRLVRYVVDHRILPNASGVPIKNKRGQPRTLTESEAFSVAVAAHLLQAGITRMTTVSAVKKLASQDLAELKLRLGTSVVLTVDLAAIRKQLFSL